jgi:hypothetical protein
MNVQAEKFRRDYVACREFEVRLFDGAIARLVFTLARDGADTVGAPIARRLHAKMHGFAFIPDHQMGAGLAFCASDAISDVDGELQQLISDLVQRFLVEAALLIGLAPSQNVQTLARKTGSLARTGGQVSGDIDSEIDLPPSVSRRAS